MSDIVERLRAMQGMGDAQLKALMDGVGQKAADEIDALREALEQQEASARIRGENCEALRAEIVRLTETLKRANEQTEHFERGWYLRGDEIEHLRAELGALRNQEPVAWMSSRNGFICKENKNPDYNLALYTHPIPSAPSVPEGWQLVPIEPTTEMLRAANAEWEGKPTAMIWADMLAAAQKPVAA